MECRHTEILRQQNFIFCAGAKRPNILNIMKIFISFFCFIIVSAVSADVVENVVVDTSQAPSNYVVSYKINPPDGYVGCTAYINAIISSDNGNSYPFYFRGESDGPNFSVEYSGKFYTTVNAGNHSFNFHPKNPVVIPNAKIMVDI